MEKNYVKHQKSCDFEMSPVIFRLQALKEYQSPWKFLPSIKRVSRSTVRDLHGKQIMDIGKRQIKLELPKIATENMEKLERSLISGQEKSIKKRKSYILQSHERSIKKLTEDSFSSQKRHKSPLRNLVL